VGDDHPSYLLLRSNSRLQQCVRHMPDRRILVVDDEPAITAVLAEVLSSVGFSAEPVESAERAREKLLEGGFLVAIIDYVMPREDGASLANLARQCGTAVILMSGEPRAMQSLPDTGFHFLEKPFRVRDLLRVVELALADCTLAADSRPAD
jgi:DNA-binding NtrC family response regulator